MRKKILKTLIASFLICTQLIIPAFAQSAVVNASYVNVRSGPGLNYNVINCLAKGTSIEITDSSNGEWYAISYNGQSGYMSSKYISLSSSTVTVSADTSSPTGLMTADEFDAYIAANPPANAETTPVPDSVVTAVPETSPLPSPTPETISTPEIVISVTPVPTTEPTPTPSSEPEVTSAGVTAHGTICGDYVRFRTGPGTTYTIITMYNKGQEITILGTAGDWTKCSVNAREGYVYSTYIKTSTDTYVDSTPTVIETITSPASQTSNTTPDSLSSETLTSNEHKSGYINGNNVRLRTAPSLSSEIIKELYFGNTIEITGLTGEWTAVITDGKSGYVFSQYVKEGSYAPSSSSSTSSSSNVSGSDIVEFAMKYLGTKYKYGGQDPSTGFDCSGFVYYVYDHFGFKLNRTAQDQSLNGATVSAADLQPGDILCFYTSGNSIGHSGIYIGDNKFIHSANSNTGVIITQLSGYYSDRGYVAKRII